MTADELLERASSRLLTEYMVLYQIKAEEAEKSRQGEDAVIHDGRPDRTDDEDEDDEPDDGG